MPGYTSVNTPPQWLTISWAKQANIHSQPRAEILQLCFHNFPKVRTADEGQGDTQCCLCGKELCGKGQGGAFPAVAVAPRVGRAVGTFPCRSSRAPRVCPAF